MSIATRPYQREAIDAVHKAAAEGLRRGLVVLPTGGGKTITFAHLIRERGGRAVVLAHRDELVRQAVDKLWMVDPAMQVGVVKADEDEVSAPVVVASVQTLARPSRLDRLVATTMTRSLFGEPEPFGTLIVDECFPAGTPIETMAGPVPIERVSVGDIVASWDRDGDEEDCIVCERVTGVMQRKPGALVRVVLADGRSLCCTPSHPIWAGAGWIRASLLKKGDSIAEAVRLVRNLDRPDAEEQPSRVLLAEVQEGLLQQRGLRDDGQDEQDPRIRQDEGAQPDALRRDAPEGEGVAAEDRAQASDQGRERDGADGSASHPGFRSRGLADGGGSSDENAQVERVSDGVQGGHLAPDAVVGDRGGWGQPQLDRAAQSGREEGCALVLARVDRVEVLEPGRDGTFGGVCPDGLVYNLEVERTHTYLADGFVVHNCHHYPAGGEDGNTFGRVLEGLGSFRGGGPLTVGFTATPDALMAQDGLAGGWERTVFQLGILDGIAGGWLVDIRAKQVQVAADFRQLHTRGGEIRDEESEQMLLEADAPHHVAQAYLAHARDRKGVVFTPTVLVAHRMAAALRDAGVPAEAVDGAMPMDERRAVLRRLTTGETRVACNCNVLTEGWDEPSISCVVMARPTKSRPFALQCIGRGLRPFPGKADCLVLDVVGSAVRQDLMTVAALFGVSQKGAGRGVLQAVLDVQEAAQKAGQTPPQGRLIVRDVALFDRHAFAWVQGSGGDRFILSLGKDGNLILEPCAADPERWDVVQSQRVVVPGAKFPQTVRKRLYTGLDLNLAMGIAEDRVRQAGAQGLNARDARWRHDQPSEKQEAILRKSGRWRDGMSRGDASDAITAMFAR